MLLLSLLAGVAYAVTVPAVPAASWAIRMAWLGDERGYLAGVKRAVMVLMATLLVILLPLHVVLLGPATAVVHALVNILFATSVLDALLLSYRKVPFACSYVPIENPKLVWPVGFASLLAVTYGFADVERWALQTTTRAIALGVALGAIALLMRAIDRTRRRQRRSINFDDRPALATQRLGLSEHITTQE
jgi:hypothetical protein